MTSRRFDAFDIPNLLTLSRIAAAPILVWLLIDPTPMRSNLATVLFFLACLSDWLDGRLARRRGTVTNIGKFLDPLADKVLILSALIMLCAATLEPRVPAWIVVLLTAREVGVTTLRAIASDEGIVLGSEALGKAKTIFETVALVPLLAHASFGPFNLHAAGLVFLWYATALALWSGMTYLVKLGRALREPATNESVV